MVAWGMFSVYTSNHTNVVDVLFCVEHYDREIEVVLELTRLLEQKNIKVAIASTIFDVFAIVNHVKTKVVVTASTAFGEGSVGSLLYERYAGQLKFINLNYEQFISSWKGAYKSSASRISKDEQVQCVWGQYYKDILVAGGYNPQNIVITGRPHLEYLKKKKKDFHLKRSELLTALRIDPSKKLVFVALTDGLAFVGEEKIRYIVSQGAFEDQLRDSVEGIKKNLKELFSQIVNFRSKDHHFILRPHPSVAIAKYNNIIQEVSDGSEDIQHISILKDYDAYTWLMLCDVFITNYSTLCIEAAYLDVPTFAFQKNGEELGQGVWYMQQVFKTSKLESITEPVPTKLKGNNFYMDFQLNGMELTMQVILDHANSNNVIPKSHRLPIFFRKRLLGSIIRNLAMKIRILLRFIPRTIDLEHDYFKDKHLAKKLEAMRDD